MHIEDRIEQLDARFSRIESMLEKIAGKLSAITGQHGPSDDRELNTKEAALHLGLSTHSLYRLVHEGAITYYKSIGGGRNIFLLSDLDRWKNSRRGTQIPSTDEALAQADNRRAIKIIKKNNRNSLSK